MTDLIRLRDKITSTLDFHSAGAALDIIAEHFGVETKAVPCPGCQGKGRVTHKEESLPCRMCYSFGELVERDWTKSILNKTVAIKNPIL